MLYEQGDGVSHDLVKALKWNTLAASKRNRNGLRQLALMNRDGIGVERNPMMAYALLNWIDPANYAERSDRDELAASLALHLSPAQISEPKKIAESFPEKWKKYFPESY